MIFHKIIDFENNEIGKMELKEGVFGIKPKKHLIKDVVVMQLANRRGGNASTKGRSEVRGGGRKPFKQKGTGQARQGTSRSPLMPGGGIVFGPKKRDYSFTIPKKVKKTALKTVLILKKDEDKLFLFDNLNLQNPKTKDALKIFGKLNLKGALVVDGENKNLMLAVRNIRGYKFIKPEGINVFDVLKYDGLIMTKQSMEKVEEALLK